MTGRQLEDGYWRAYRARPATATAGRSPQRIDIVAR
jgi:hypothetical protein